MFAGMGHYVIEVKVDSSAALAFFSSSGSRTHEAHRLSGLVASKLDCSGRCETEKDPERADFGGHVDAHTKCEGAGGIFTVDWSSMLQ